MRCRGSRIPAACPRRRRAIEATSGSGSRRRGRVSAGEQRLPEATEDEEVPVLLLHDHVFRSHLQEEAAGRAVGVPHGHVAVVGFREELEPVPARALDEIDEQKGLVDLGEIVVEEEGVGLVSLEVERFLQDRGEDRVRRDGLSRETGRAPAPVRFSRRGPRCPGRATASSDASRSGCGPREARCSSRTRRRSEPAPRR